MKTSIIKEKSYAFALRVVAMACWLREQREYDLTSQVMRSGTGIGSNIEEALAGVSRADFVARMGIASREARETHYWLRLLRDSQAVPAPRINPLLDECTEIVRVLTTIVKTGQKRKLAT